MAQIVRRTFEGPPLDPNLCPFCPLSIICLLRSTSILEASFRMNPEVALRLCGVLPAASSVRWRVPLSDTAVCSLFSVPIWRGSQSSRSLRLLIASHCVRGCSADPLMRSSSFGTIGREMARRKRVRGSQLWCKARGEIPPPAPPAGLTLAEGDRGDRGVPQGSSGLSAQRRGRSDELCRPHICSTLPPSAGQTLPQTSRAPVSRSSARAQCPANPHPPPPQPRSLS